jgi:hypothetical protein
MKEMGAELEIKAKSRDGRHREKQDNRHNGD